MNSLQNILNKGNRRALLIKYRLVCIQEVQHLPNSETKNILLEYYIDIKISIHIRKWILDLNNAYLS